MRKKVISVLLSSAMAVSMLAGCGSAAAPAASSAAPAPSSAAASTAAAASTTESSAAATSTAAATEESVAANTVTGDPAAKNAFVVWGWNDDVKKILDNCFAKDDPDDYSRIVFVNSGGSDYYQDKIDALLSDQSNELYPDMMALEIDYVQKYVQSGELMSMKDLGITSDDLSNQYDFNVKVCSNADDGQQYASFWQATPGAWNLRADLCKKYLGTTDPAELQKMFATWADVEATADKINKASGGKCELLSGWDDLNRVYTNNRKTGWYDKDDKIVIDDQVKAYFEEAKKFHDNGWTFNTKQWDSDWAAMKDGDGSTSNAALAYTGCPWFTYWCLTDTWKNNTILIPGPQSYYWGGTGLAVPKGCADTELAAKLIKYFTCDKDSMETISKFNSDFVNNKAANAELMSAGSIKSDYMFGDQDYMKVYSDILSSMKVDTSIVTAEDKGINDNLGTYVQEYIDNGDYDTAVNDLKAYIHDTYNYLKLE